MSQEARPSPATSTPQSPRDQVALARELFRRFYAECFWHSPRDLEIDENHVGFVANALRTHGGRRGFMLAAELQAKRA
jgi:hypothetical protein